ncbi:MAG: carboxymuconolactone decarboxylase family protein [Negativicutes bacterium]|nr:carboxymuconolactone decarboxylase family protein [Negativicutes bacterium]
MTFDLRTIALISIGASVAANCQPCLRHHSTKSQETDLSDEEIQAATEVGKAVRMGAAKQMDQLLARLGKPSSQEQSNKSGCCC